nr:beta-phosphoglucomutase family hydrolase [Desulfobacterales bacterium]
MASKKFKGAILDLDGVITGTARVHALAWESMFNLFLKQIAERDKKPFMPFDKEKDYLEYVDGKPRPKGVQSFLESRGIEFPYGELDDPPDKETICGMGNRKNIDFQDVLRREGPDLYETSVKFIKELKRRGIKVGVASSSRNCQTILQLAEIENLFDTRVDGEVSRELNLHGKPDPDIFVVAANNIGLKPGACMVVEDAISGVQAGKNGNFGLVLGVAREVDGSVLKQNGADIVVQDLGDISVNDIIDWFETDIQADGWNLSYNSFDKENEKLRETLTVVGNGYFGTRGCFEGAMASDKHYPGTYIAGIYNKLPTKIQGKNIYNNDFVNCPNWTLIEFRIGSQDFRNPLEMELLDYEQTLCVRDGVMMRSIICRDKLGRLTKIRTKRIASMASPHLAAIEYDLTPLNYSEKITIRSSLDGTVVNDGVARYRDLKSKHLSPVAQGKTRNGIFLHVQTNRSNYQIIMNARISIKVNGKTLPLTKALYQNKGLIGEKIEIPATEGTTYSLSKIVSIYTSLDQGITNLKKAAFEAVAPYKTFHDLYPPHAKAWKVLWQKADITIKGDRLVQQTARLHIYHLLVTASPHNKNIDAGITARGLHGEAYRGHIFWDEIYILPFYNRNFPEISKALLMYRYNRLDAARKYAKDNGYKGAMYPWQTADDGTEETQVVHYNPKDGSWGPDLSLRQRHVSIAVFYDVWNYIKSSGDMKFSAGYGAEIMLEIARFWASIANFDNTTEKYHIKGVMGPDEFHEKIPGTDEAGIRDNAYTNIMVVWLLEKALGLIDDIGEKRFKKLYEKIGFDINETDKWRDITKKMNVILDENGIISQFDGYMDLKELDWEQYRKKYGDIHRLDRILKAEGKSPDDYKLAKQADVLMMFYILSPGEVGNILNRLGYKIDDPLDILKKNYDFYEKRTSHGSTLSKVVHAVVSSYIHSGGTAWDWFLESIKSDIYDTQGGTTIEGIHTGVMAGTLDVIIRYFAGINFSGSTPDINPHLPEHWDSLSFRICDKKIWYNFEFTQKSLSVMVEAKGKPDVHITVNG